MDPIKYARALKSVKFSRLLTREEVRPFVEAYSAGDTQALGVLNDKMQDEGDPRADIWDRAKGLTQHPDPAWQVTEGWKQHSGHTPIDRESLQMDMGFYGTGGDYFLFRPVTRLPHESVPEAVNISHGYYIGDTKGRRHLPLRSANFTPEEARALAYKFPEEHAQKIHEFLDTHFGPRPEHS